MTMQDQIPLFGDVWPNIPETEGIKYAGSKLKLLPHILKLARKTEAKSVFDGFSGSTRVSQAFAQAGYRVISNDLSSWSRSFGICYLLNKKEPYHYRDLIRHLNTIPPKDGWFTRMYGGDIIHGSENNGIQRDGSKKPWQKKNTRKLDSIRDEIDRLNLDMVTENIAITSLVLALDRVDSTLGHFASYLKRWSPRSFNDLELQIPNLWINQKHNQVLEKDIFVALDEIDTDLAYYDPPYGSNNDKMPPSRIRYASYYHIWTTIVKNDKPDLFGKAFRRKDTSDKIATSIFEEFRRNGNGKFIVTEAIEKLLRKTPCRWIILSYSSGGRATAKELNEAMNDNGKLIDTIEIDYKRNVMAAMKWTNEWLRAADEPNREFLFLLRKD